MPLTVDGIIHQNSGGVAASSANATFTVSLANPGVQETTTAGNTVVVLMYCPGVSFGSRAGWTGSGSTVRRYVRGPSEALADGEFSWDFVFPASGTFGRPCVWAVFEYEGPSGDSASGLFDASLFGTDTAGNTAQLLSGQTSTYDGQVVCVHAAYDSVSTTPPTWGGHSGGFTEVLERGQASGSASVGMSVSILPVQSLGSFGADATVTRSGGGPLDATNLATLHTFVLNAEGARKAANIYQSDCAAHGSATNNAVVAGHLINTSVGITAGVSISTAAARSGTYGWLLSSTAAACNYGPSSVAFSVMGSRPPKRRCFRFPSLPPNDTEIWQLRDTTAGTGVNWTFRHVSGGQIGLTITGGSEVVSDSVFVANQWFAIDVRPGVSTGALSCSAIWTVDYNAALTDTTPGVSQTAASGSPSAGVGTLVSERVGWASARTATMHTTDAFGSADPSHYPLGDLRGIPLKVDPAGTPTATNSANAGVTTNNFGAVGAWNATNARNAVDDVPPVSFPDQDAVVVTGASPTETITLPAETIDLAAQGLSVRGVHLTAEVVAASATTATIRLSQTDGVSTITLLNEADPGADNATPVWAAGMFRLPTGRKDWTQSLVDNLAVVFGSNDATPDIGIGSFVFTLVCAKAQPEDLFGEAGAPVHVQAHRDPDSLALVGATVTNNSGAAVELTWEVSGVPDTSGSIPDGTAGLYVPMSADGSIETVGRVDLIAG